MLDWRSVLDEEDERALLGYARPRGAFGGKAPTLLVIDVTESFVGPDVPVLEAQQTFRQACGELAWAALPAITSLLSEFRARQWPVVFTAPDPNQSWVGGATRGVPDPQGQSGTIVDTIRPRDGESVLLKTKASAFFGTPLVSGLTASRSDTVALVGGTTSGCIRSTAVDATSYGFQVLVAADACFDRSRLSHAVSLRDLDAKYARVLSSQEMLNLLGDIAV